MRNIEAVQSAISTLLYIYCMTHAASAVFVNLTPKIAYYYNITIAFVTAVGATLLATNVITLTW